jgi:hypothetical protein
MGPHGQHSGFDKLFEEINALYSGSICQLCVPGQHYQPTILNRILCRARHLKPQKPPTRPTSPFTESRHELVSTRALGCALRDPDVTLLLSAEKSQYCGPLADAEKRIRNRIALFLHQPPSWLEQNWSDWGLMDDLKAIFCLGPKRYPHGRAV